MKKLTMIDWCFLIGYLSYIGFTGVDLFKNGHFSADSFGEGLMFLLFGHGAHKGGIYAAQAYVDSKQSDDGGKP